ncbi:MAG: radical SAM protein, partial [Clostridiales bacterium]|nr:radical SAM protein [Clostridiales bacterium]
RRIMDEAAKEETIHTVFFGGIGEPTFHPRFLDMVKLAKQAGKRVECVTNGTLLTPEAIRELIAGGLDMAWISVDGFDEDHYEAVRKNGKFSVVYRNLIAMRDLRETEFGKSFGVGLAFVAMRENINELPKLINFAQHVHACDIKITNLLPYTEEAAASSLIWKTINNSKFQDRLTTTPDSMGDPPCVHIDFPLMDIDETTMGPIAYMLDSLSTFSIMGEPLHRRSRYCKFVMEGNCFVRWDGDVTPCMGLLHDTEAYIYKQNGFTRKVSAKSFGNTHEKSLMEVWRSPEFAAFRQRVRDFDFSPCHICGGCSYIYENKQDCFLNEHPTCGACLWAQGMVQCP